MKRSGPPARKTQLKTKKPINKVRKVKASERGVAVKALSGGREECTASWAGIEEYKRRTWAMAKRQGYACAWHECGKAFTEYDPPTFDHGNGRTAGRKDERITTDGTPDGPWQNAALHGRCNRKKGSRKFAWIGGEYVMVMKGEKR